VLGDDVSAVGFPLTSAPIRSGHLGMWESCSTSIIGLRTPVTLLFYMALREGGPLSQMAGALQRAELETEDYFP
jgi:hypothetical protein